MASDVERQLTAALAYNRFMEKRVRYLEFQLNAATAHAGTSASSTSPSRRERSSSQRKASPKPGDAPLEKDKEDGPQEECTEGKGTTASNLVS